MHDAVLEIVFSEFVHHSGDIHDAQKRIAPIMMRVVKYESLSGQSGIPRVWQFRPSRPPQQQKTEDSLAESAHLTNIIWFTFNELYTGSQRVLIDERILVQVEYPVVVSKSEDFAAILEVLRLVFGIPRAEASRCCFHANPNFVQLHQIRHSGKNHCFEARIEMGGCESLVTSAL